VRLLDLFSGIGGFSLGLGRAGFKTVAFCEIEPFCRDVLRKNWPDVPIYEDVRNLTAERLRADGIEVDAICGGFPCQDISLAGKGAGLSGQRSGLWSEYARLIGELRPRVVIVENVAALRNRGLDRVLGEMATLGYDAEWHCIPASAVGAPHRRDRVWVIAYASGGQLRLEPRRRDGADGTSAPLTRHDGTEGLVADADQPRLEGWLRAELQQCADQRAAGAGSTSVADDAERRWGGQSDQVASSSPKGADRGCGGECGTSASWWLTEPDVGRVANGVPARVHRLRALGNAVVPQIPEIIGRAIVAAGL
jgi:DNA (cytosine-5)-methyltransferase 1